MNEPDIAPRHYSAKPWVLSLVVYFVVTFGPLVAMYIALSLGKSPPGWLTESFLEFYFLSIICSVTWFCWGLPVYCSGHIEYLKFRHTPQRLMHSYRLAAWMPAVFVLAVVLINLVGMPIESYYYLGFWEWPTFGSVITWVAGLIVIAGICHGVSRLMQRRFVRTVLAASLCLSCGYELRGITSTTCPECGEPIPSPQTLPEAAEAGASG